MFNGLSWIAIGNITGRVIGLIGQLATGWLISPADFGIYAFATSICSLVAAARSGGILHIAIQRGRQFDPMVDAYFRYALFFNFVAMLILLLIAIPFLAHQPDTAIILAAIAISIPVGTHGTLAKAKLTIERRFRELSIISLISALIWQLSVVGAAALHFGPVSFAVAALAQASYESIASWRKAHIHLPQNSRLPTQTFMELAKEGKWVMLGAALLALATSGDYFAVSLLTDPITAGTYFFSFQLVASLCMPINNSLEGVLPTTLCKLTSDRTQQEKLLRDIMMPLIVISIPAAIFASLMVPATLHSLWGGKWDTAIDSTAIMMLCIPCWLLTTTARSMLESCGWWRFRFIFLLIYGIGGMGSAALGALQGGDMKTITMSVTAFYASFCVAANLALTKQGVSLSGIAIISFKTASICILSFLAAKYSSSYISFPNAYLWSHTFTTAAIFLTAITIGNILLMRNQWKQIILATRNHLASQHHKRASFA